MSEFELKSLRTALNRLLNDGVLKNQQQFDKLFEVYKNDPRKYPLIHDEINKLRFNDKLLEEKLKQDLLIAGVEAKEVDTKKKEEKPLSLENVTDFEKDGKNYIKIHYPDDSVRVIENRTDPYKSGKERFEEIKKTQELVSTDGVTNATSIFEQTLARDCIEVTMKDVKEVSTPTEFSKLTKEQKDIVYGTLRAIIADLPIADEDKKRLSSQSVEAMLRVLNKKVYLSPEENIVVLCTPNESSKDEVKTLNTEKTIDTKGNTTYKYTLSSLNEKGYKYESSHTEMNGEDDVSYNSEYQLSEEGDPEKEMGASYKPKAPWQRRNKNNAAFINLSWSIILIGILAALVLMYILNMFIK